MKSFDGEQVKSRLVEVYLKTALINNEWLNKRKLGKCKALTLYVESAYKQITQNKLKQFKSILS